MRALPPSTDLEAAVNRLKSRRENGFGLFAQARSLAEAESLLRDGKERDRFAAMRPEGCDCLGTGLLGDDRWCSCPDGIAGQADADRRALARHKSDADEFIRRSRIPARNAASFGALPDFDGSMGLFLSGPAGRGKTQKACELLRRWIAENCRAGLFVTVPELLDSLRDTYRKDAGAPEGELLSFARRVPLLVLDDLGTEKPSEWVEEKLYVLINHRYGAMLPTIFTSNYTLKELGEKWHERIAWRIAESCGVVNLKGPNWRARS